MRVKGYTTSGLRRRCAVWCALAAAFWLAAPARAEFVGYYELSNWQLINTNADGYVEPTIDGLILTGGNVGSGELIPGTTDLVIRALGAGPVHFSFLYSSLDLPTFDYAAYVVEGTPFYIADTDGTSGVVDFSVRTGDLFGFRVGTVDNQFEPGVLQVADFSAPAPVPEPGTLALATIAIGAVFAARRIRAARRSAAALLLALSLAASPAVFAQTVQVHYPGSNVTGQLVKLWDVTLPQQIQPLHSLRMSTAGPEYNKRAPGTARYPVVAKRALTMTLSSAVPAMTSMGVSGTTAFGFDGLTHYDQRNANGGNQLSVEPPSPVIAVANGFIVEAVNDAFRVYSTSGAPLLAVLSTNQVFGLGPEYNRSTDVYGPSLADPRVFWDPDIRRWFLVQRLVGNDASGNPTVQSNIYLAVSQSDNPLGTYTVYTIDTTNWLRAGCPCYSDYPQVGADQNGFYISANQFNFYGTYVDASILAISKASLAAGAAAPATYEFVLPPGEGYGFTIQPATTPPGASYFTANGGLEYFVSSLLGSSGSGLGLWAMTNTISLATGIGSPAMVQTVVPTIAYQKPPNVIQRPGTYYPYGQSLGMPLPPVDGGDTRVQSVVYAGGRLYVTLSTGVTDEAARYLAGGGYFVVSPSYRGGLLTGAVFRQGYLMLSNNHLLRPAIAVNAQGAGAIAFTLIGPDYYPSAAFVPFAAFTPAATVQVAAFGAFPEDGFTGYDYYPYICRWGDYSNAVVGTDGAIWMSTEYIPNSPRTDYANWGTFVMRHIPQ